MKQQINSSASLSRTSESSSGIASSSSYDDLVFSSIAGLATYEVIDTEFTNCTFENCKLMNISFSFCRFERCEFKNCDLSLMVIKHTSFRGVRFIDTKLSGIQWADASIPLDVNFNRCLMNYSGFIKVDLRNTEMIECQLKEADFSEANLTKANCLGSDFSGARFSNTNLTRTNFTNATNYAIHPQGNKLCKTIFSLPEALSLLNVFDIVIK